MIAPATMLDRHDLHMISQATLAHYDDTADAFWEGTRDHDVSQNITAILHHIEGERPFTILDFGCGPGRDLKVFTELGHIAIGLEGATQLAAMARAYSGCEVWQQDFLKLDYPRTISMAYSPMPRCFMSPARSCRACYSNCMHV